MTFWQVILTLTGSSLTRSSTWCRRQLAAPAAEFASQGNDYPAEVVRSKLLKLNSEHIRFVTDCLKQNTTRIRNIRQYLLAMLFNAASTTNSYYTALVAHDKVCG